MRSYYAGIEAYFSHVNENGGIYGRKVNLISRDDNGLPARAVSSNAMLINSDNVIALISTAPSCSSQAAISSSLNFGARGIPNLFVDCLIEKNSEDSEQSSPARTSTSYYGKVGGQNQIAILKSFADKNFPNQKIALVYQDDSYASAVTKLSSDSRIHCSGRFISGLPVTVNLEEICKKNGGLKDGDLVFYSGAPSGLASLIAQVQKKNLKLKYFVNDDAFNQSMFSAVGIPTNSMPEIYSVSSNSLISETSNPATGILLAIGQKYRGSSTVDQRFLTGMNAGYIVSNLLGTIGPEVTRERFLQAMDLYGAQFDVLGLSQRSQDPATKFMPLGGVVVKHIGSSVEAVSEVMSVENGAISLKPRKQIAISPQALPILIQKLPNSVPQPKPSPTPTSAKSTPSAPSPSPITELDGEEEAPFGKISVGREKNKYIISVSSNLPNESLQVRATRKGQKSVSFKVETDDDGLAKFSTSRSLAGFQLALLFNGERLSSVRAN
jgi:ABC-type branched-subunit amino acid transport system substrate-binding protein